MKCPKCGFECQLVSTLLLCSICGAIDVSQERLKEAIVKNNRMRIPFAVCLFALIISVIALINIYPDFYRSNSSKIDNVAFFLIIAVAIYTNIYVAKTMKKDFPEVTIE